MRSIELYPKAATLEPTAEQLSKLGQWLEVEISDALSARSRQDALWRQLLREYDAVPVTPVRNTPIEGHKNIEIPLGAIAADSVYAQMIDLIFTVSPLVTCRPSDKTYIKHSKAFQRFINHMADHEVGLRPAVEHTILDNCQMGTGFYYVPMREFMRRAHSYQVHARRPQVISMPIEDVLFPGGVCEDLQLTPWWALRFWYTKSEMESRAKLRKWDITKIAPTGSKDWVRHQREALSRTTDNVSRRMDVYEVFDIYAYYDINDDGIDEDILVTYDWTSRSVLRVRFMPYDMRPGEKTVYQPRAHMAYGIGVMEMLSPLQQEITELHNHQTINVMLANMRLWKGRPGLIAGGTLKLWPNRFIPLADPDGLKGEALADVYPSLQYTQTNILSLSERRTGLNDMTQPRQSQVFGNRTPGITALSLLQQVNKRFTPAFDGVRIATSRALVQCAYRYAEQIRDAGPVAKDTEAHLARVLGKDDATLVADLFKQEDFDQNVIVELTASSASVNRDADRQNSIILVNLLAQYYEKAMQLVAIASNPQVPDTVRSVAMKVAQSSTEIIDRTIRTFDQVRDPSTFLIDVTQELNAAQQDSDMLAQAQAVAAMLGPALQNMGVGGGAGVPPGTA